MTGAHLQTSQRLTVPELIPGGVEENAEGTEMFGTIIETYNLKQHYLDCHPAQPLPPDTELMLILGIGNAGEHQLLGKCNCNSNSATAKPAKKVHH